MDLFSGFVLASLGLLLIIPLVCLILTVIGMWVVLTKTKEEGWKALIPVYNRYVLCSKIGVNPYWALVAFGLALLTSVPVLGVVAFLGGLYFQVLFSVSLAKSFGRDPAFAVGLILLPPVFYLILAFSSEYKGAIPMEDVVLNFINENLNGNTKNTNKDAKPADSYCTKCGGPLKKEDTFCPKCGNKIGE